MPSGIPGKVIVICFDCGENREHYAKGLCQRCYMRHWKEEHREEWLNYCRRWNQENPDYDRCYYQEHREEIRANSRRWDRENPDKVLAKYARRRARRRALIDTLTAKQAERLMSIGRAIYPGEELHLDHIVPLSRGGGTTLANMHAIPAELNCSKAAALPEEVYQQMRLYKDG